ncbi:MAG: site-specific DNA-methyltransferase [Candidatus Peribacteria bacterium]|nr:site-specific DNA-methyltransferase [Candidatus Peribacteria bacterium]
MYEEIRSYLKTEGKEFVDLVLLHPPYFDIVQFSKEKADLSNAGSLDEFLEMFKKVIQHSASLLKKGGYMGMVIGDKYQNSERIPLGFLCMQQAQQVGLKLKSIIVKNMEGNRGKL